MTTKQISTSGQHDDRTEPRAVEFGLVALNFHLPPSGEAKSCSICGLPIAALKDLECDGYHRARQHSDPPSVRWVVKEDGGRHLRLDGDGLRVDQYYTRANGTAIAPEEFHQSPNPDADRCPICGLASECFKTRWQNRRHRARREGDPPAAMYFLQPRANSIHALDAAGKRLPASRLVTEPIRERLRQAAGRIAFGVPTATVAGLLGIKKDTLYRSMKRYAAVFREEMQRTKAQGVAALAVPINREEKEKIAPWVRKAIRGVTAAIAAGMTREEATSSMELLPGSIDDWTRRYPKLWQDELARAMEVSLTVVRQLAGTEAVAVDPDAYLRQAGAAERWARKKGRALFPPAETATLASFYRDHYKKVRLFDASKSCVKTYELILRRWVLLTGDPPLAEITVNTLAQFRDCIAKMAGRDRVGRRSAASVHQYLMHVQAILDKAGPPGPRNRDAADLIARPPWIRRPRIDAGFPKIATLDQLDALFRSCVSADKPRLPGIKPPAWWRALLAVALSTGLRKRTLFELRMEHLDWDKRLLIIPARHLKTRRPLIAHLNATALAHLLVIRTARELVFPWPHGEHEFYGELHRLETLAGIKRKDQFGLHRIRKTTATLLWESNPQAAQLALGHSTDRVTRQFYVSGAGIMARAIDAMPQPAAFTEGLALPSPATAAAGLDSPG